MLASLARIGARRGLQTAAAAAAAPQPVLLLGDERLHAMCTPVADVTAPDAARKRAALVATLEDFRAKHGFGRGIAAPQIGVLERFIALNLGDGPFTLSNPRITWRSPETLTLWDDCMSLPFVLCRVERSASVTVEYEDEDGQARVLERQSAAVSELLQHELDHLDGVLITDKAAPRGGIVARELYEANREKFDAQVDYAIAPTV